MSDLHGRPTAAELVDAVIGYLRDELMETLEGGARHRVRIAVHALEIVGRELSRGPGQAEAHAGRLASLGLATDAELAEAIRDGTQPDRGELREVLTEDTRDRLLVANPRWLPSPDGP
jgi:hypothetical protein